MRLRLLAVRMLLLGALQAHAAAYTRQGRPFLSFFAGSTGAGAASPASPVAAASSSDPSPSPSPAPSPSPVPPEPPSPDPYDPDDPDHDPEMFLPLLFLAIFLTVMAGSMSGLTLGLMSLDEVDIEILRRSGTERQKRLARRIQPVLRRPHVLLTTLLVCNALAAEALPLVLDRLADPVTAIVVSVTVVLFFGEIIPQAACSRYGLEIGATSAPFVQALMWITSPISFPIGWVLDKVLGHRHTALFRRAELKALVDIHKEGQEFGGQLSADEVSIIKGALDMTHKTARHAMTPIDMVFMLPADTVLDEDTLTAIMASGHSRIPVHRPGNRGAILGIMLVKELLLVSLSQAKMVGRQKVRSLPAVRADTPLYDMLKLFEIGRSHMAVLMQLRKEAAQRQRQQREEHMMVHVDSMSDDPSVDGEDADSELDDLLPRRTASPEDFIFDATDFEPVGIITIEDVLEELLQVEILDETDKFVDNMQRTPVTAALIMGSLPPHLRTVLGARALLPRIGGAAFMEPSGSERGMHMLEPELPLDRRGQARAAAAPGARAAAAKPAAAAAAAVVAAVAAAEPHANGGSAGSGQTASRAGASPNGASPTGAEAAAGGRASGEFKSPRRVGLQVLSPQMLSPRALSPIHVRGGTDSPPHGGTAAVPAALLMKQGSMGASLVAEALRQEIAAQLSAGAGKGGGSGGGGSVSAGHSMHGRRVARSRSRSPLPGNRHGLSLPEGLPLPQIDAPAGSTGAQQQQQQQRQQGGAAALEPLPAIFQGLRRSRSDAVHSGGSGAATPRLGVQLPPPPPRRSTNIGQRVQEQIDLLQPLLIGSRQASGSTELDSTLPRTEGPDEDEP